MDDIERMYVRNLEAKGLNAILNLLQEECAELIVGVSHFRRDNTNKKEIIEEIADVRIMLDQVAFNMDLTDEVREVQAEKLYRLRKRLNKGIDR